MQGYVPIDFVRELGRHVHEAMHEDQFATRLVTVLHRYVRCDVIVLQWAGLRLEARPGPVQTAQGHNVIASEDGWVPSGEAERAQWLAAAEGIVYRGAAPALEPHGGLADESLRMGMEAVFATPLIHAGELYGRLLFGWSETSGPDDPTRRYLRGVADIVGYHVLAFWERTEKQGDTEIPLRKLVDLADERVRRQRVRLGVPAPERPLSETGFARWVRDWPDGILVTDDKFEVIYVNPAYEKMSGYSFNEWLGKTPGFAASGKTPPETYKQMWHSIEDTGTWTGYVINRRRDGSEWVSFLSITRIVGDEGQVIGYLAGARDVSNSRWTDDPSIQDPFQEAFTQEALAFALAEAGQIHEGGSRRHLERIRDYTRLLVLGAMDAFEPLQKYEMRTAVIMSSIMHDIGKLAIPEGLLRKPARLTSEEYDLIKTHTVAGEQLLRSPYLSRGLAAPESSFLSVAAAIARSHHERWDGAGYPDGLVAEQIPLAARIVAIADVYDALRSPRAYKPPWQHEETVNYIAGGAGSQFDPKLVAIFLDLAPEFDAVDSAVADEPDVRTDGRSGLTEGGTERADDGTASV